MELPLLYGLLRHAVYSFDMGAGAVCSIEEVLHHIDNAIQYGEDADVKIRDFEAPEGDDDM